MNYATFYTISNTVIIIIVIVIITLLGSHWLLSVSVLELKLSDWFTSPDHWCFYKSGFFLGAFFFFYIYNSCLVTVSEGKFGNRWSRLLSLRVLHEIKDPSRPEPRSTSARCHSVLVSIKFKSFGDFAALRVSLRWSSKTLKHDSDLVRVQRDKSVYALYIIWWMVMVMLRININSNLMNEWINEWVN